MTRALCALALLPALVWSLFVAKPACDSALGIRADKVLRPVPPLLAGHNVKWVWGGQGLFRSEKEYVMPGEGFGLPVRVRMG